MDFQQKRLPMKQTSLTYRPCPESSDFASWDNDMKEILQRKTEDMAYMQNI